MIYETPEAYLQAPRKAVALFGMSGLGKTTVATMLREAGSWFHYSVDYRIGTRYMGEHIADNFKAAAMQVPLLRELLMTDSVYIASNITFENLAPLSTYLGKPGNPDKGGIPFDEYLVRQRQHRQAEISAMLDTVPFIDRAARLYGYAHFLCDTSGSLCEVVDAEDPEDPVLSALAPHVLFAQIVGTEADAEELAARFDRAPKPMYYPEDFLRQSWEQYLAERGLTEREVDPDDFIRWGYRRLMEERRPRYAAIARNWGVTLRAADLAKASTPEDFDHLVAEAIAAKAQAA
ncbi:ATPase [Rhodobacteraceae bacterium NNCM2]|nr:ATPase [Coraliihabitans acroporae]